MKTNLLVSLVAALALVALPMTGALAQVSTSQASVSFNPPGGNIPLGQNFDVDVLVNTGGQNSAAADVTVKFDTSKLDFVSGAYPGALTGTFYPGVVINPITADGNLVKMARTVNTSGSGDITYTNGSGTFAKLTFKTKANVQQGDTVVFSFDYTPGATNDFTNVANATSPAQDLLGTTTLPTATYVVGSGNPIGTGPVITSIAPSAGSAQNTVQVTITGMNFGAFVDGQSKVYLGTKLVQVVNWTDTQIQVQVPAEPELTQDSVRQVKVHRADGAEATYLGYRLVASGPAAMLWSGVSLMAFGLSMVSYRRPRYGSAATAAQGATPEHNTATPEAGQIHYREIG